MLKENLEVELLEESETGVPNVSVPFVHENLCCIVSETMLNCQIKYDLGAVGNNVLLQLSLKMRLAQCNGGSCSLAPPTIITAIYSPFYIILKSQLPFRKV